MSSYVTTQASPSTRPMRLSRSRLRLLASWAEADRALAELGRVEQGQTRIAARRQKALALLDGESARLEARAERLEATLEGFCRAQAAEATDHNGAHTTVLAPGRRSRRLLFGRVGFRHVHQLRVRDPERAVAALARNGLSRFLRVETALDRDTLHRGLLAARNNGGGELARRLARAGIRLETRDAWFYELHPVAVSRQR